MARHREFDHDDLLDKAMHLFWQHGYGATSIQDLVDATGVNRASMYGTFGNKQLLFQAALDHYVAKIISGRLERLRAPGSARTALRNYFDGMVDVAQRDDRQLGCLMTNSAVEIAPHDVGIAKTLRVSFGTVEEALFEVIRRGQAQGEIAADKDPRALARFLIGVIQGLRVLMRTRTDKGHLRDVVAIALSSLD
ncbi:MAG: TetR/AcrR family transcriptional regulator [Pseudomonadota bacterium]